jgi:outer membrane murein-binding lipoprotein Lpp
MKLLKKIKRAVKNFLRASSREAMRDFEVLKVKLSRIANEAREEAAELKAEVAELVSKIDDLKRRGTAELDEAARASRVADRINELLK